jgi:hypothetical protein
VTEGIMVLLHEHGLCKIISKKKYLKNFSQKMVWPLWLCDVLSCCKLCAVSSFIRNLIHVPSSPKEGFIEDSVRQGYGGWHSIIITYTLCSSGMLCSVGW